MFFILVDLPSWLKVLVLIACYSKVDKELQLAAIATLFDLITLLKSQLEHSTNPGVTFVVMIPLLKFGHVNYLESKTRAVQVMTSTLWDNLGDSSLDPNQISSLLYQLHNCLSSGIVETIIGHRIANSHIEWSEMEYAEHPTNRNIINLVEPATKHTDRMTQYKTDRLSNVKIMCTPPIQTFLDCNEMLTESESMRFKKFVLLWEYGRDSQCSSKGFEKTLLKIFDHLSLPYHVSIRTFVTKWLQESLLRGDLNRLIRPLLKIILNPGTKRVSVVHAHFGRSIEGADGTSQNEFSTDRINGGDETDGDMSIDNDVYAISSEGGNIKYHIEVTRQKVPSPIRSLQKKFFGVTLGHKNKTSNYITNDKCVSPTENAGLSLIINPFDNSSDLDAQESESGSLSGQSQTKIYINDDVAIPAAGATTIAVTDQNPNNVSSSLKEEYYSSCEEETDESYSETDSEQREESMERESGEGTQPTDIKRFSGDCERVSEILTELDRTKNRKTYQVSSFSLLDALRVKNIYEKCQ